MTHIFVRLMTNDHDKDGEKKCGGYMTLNIDRSGANMDVVTV
jgi:hypothetical protein